MHARTIPSGRGRAAVIPLLLALAACSLVVNRDNGPVRTEQRDVTGFTKVSVGGGAELTVAAGSGFHVEITAEEKVLAKLRTRVDGDRLVVESTGSYSTSRGVEVRVTLPALDGIELSGGARGTASGISADGFELILSGGSQATLDGRAGTATVEASGGSRAFLRGLSVGSADVDASGGSRIELSATDRVAGSASGGSSVDAWGGGSLAVETSGGSEAHSH